MSLDFLCATRNRQRGVSLIEILIGILIVVVASIATLNYFAYVLGNVNKQGNCRAALEQARQRLEAMLVSSNDDMKPPNDGLSHWVACGSGSPCKWVAANPNELVTTGHISGQLLQSTVRCTHDVSAGTPVGTCDVLELDAKVWFTTNTGADNDFNRTYLRTLRTAL